jgi:hypothetical protein
MPLWSWRERPRDARKRFGCADWLCHSGVLPSRPTSDVRRPDGGFALRMARLFVDPGLPCLWRGLLGSAFMPERSMVSRSADAGGDRDQKLPLRSLCHPFAEANRHHSTRVFGSNVVLDDGRSRKQAARFQDYGIHRTHPHGKGEPRIRPHRDQPPISVRFDGEHNVEPCIRHQWLPSFSMTRL